MKYREAMLLAGRAYFNRLLTETKGNVTEAAEVAGLNRTTIYKLLPKYGVSLERCATVQWIEPLGKIKP